MSAIEAASVSVKTMADGTLRISCDVEPRNANAAFALFGSPGVAMALAALKPTATPAPVEKVQPEPVKRGQGPVCKWLVIRGKEVDFQTWVRSVTGGPANESSAAGFCRVACGVVSRSDIDGNAEAERRYHEEIRGPYSRWLIARGKQSDAA